MFLDGIPFDPHADGRHHRSGCSPSLRRGVAENPALHSDHVPISDTLDMNRLHHIQFFHHHIYESGQVLPIPPFAFVVPQVFKLFCLIGHDILPPNQ